MTSSTSRNQKSTAASAEPTLDTASDAQSAPAETEAPAAGDVAVEPAVDSVAPAAAADPATAPAATDPRLVKIKLSNPLDKVDDLRRLGLDVDKEGGYKVHDEITVTPDHARMLITAGYAQVDPENPKAVEAALTPSA